MPFFLFLFDVWKNIVTNLSSAIWWGAEIPSWLLFAWLVSHFADGYARRQARIRDEPFEGWELEILHVNGEIELQDIYIDDLKRYKVSTFELIKMVKSNLSNSGWRYEPSKVGAVKFERKPNWIREDGKKLILDFKEALIQKHIDKKKGSPP